MFLASTALEEFWDKDEELLLLGPWCLPYGRRLDPRVRFEFLQDPWEDPAARKKAYDECLSAYRNFMPALSERLNAAHSTAFSERYWSIVAGPWLMRYIQLLRDRYEFVRFALERHSGLRTWTLAQSSGILVKDTADFTALCCADGYNLQLFSQICSVLGVPGQAREFQVARAPSARAGLRGRLRRGVKRGADLVRRATRRPVWLHELCIPPRDVASLVLRSKGKAWPFHAPPVNVPAPRFADRALRANFQGESLPKTTAFEKVLGATISANIPSLYVEGYPRLAKLADRGVGRTPRTIVSANGWSYDEGFKAVAAAQGEKGARLVGAQHGGGYGMYECIWQEHFERSVTDAFLCWGWSALDGDPRLSDVASPIFPWARAPRSGGDEILVVGTDLPVYRHGFHSQPSGWQFLRYMKDRETFLAGLPPALRGRVTVRLQKGELGGRQAERLRAAFPEIKVDRGERPFRERLRQCRLAVFDHPGTSWLESAALEVPSLFFWRPEDWAMRSCAEPVFERLRKVKALFDSPAEAAASLALREAALAGWSRAPEVIDAFDRLRSQFAKSSSNWRRQWLEAL